MKSVEEMTFDDLMTWATHEAFNALILGGTKTMKQAFYGIFNVAFRWHKYHVIDKEKA